MSSTGKGRPIEVAYLVNLYPKISHSFIRREVRALERQGVIVHRYAIRRSEEPLVDVEDLEEREKTTVILDLGAVKLALAVIHCAVRYPIRFARALRLAVRTGAGSDRGLLRHLAYLAEACGLRRLLDEAPVDHVHAHFGTNPAAVAMYCSALGGPGYSFTAHGTESFDAPDRIRLGVKAEHARFVVAVCEYGKHEILATSSRLRDDHVRVIRCGLDASFSNEPSVTEVSGSRLTIVGRLSIEKGHRILLDAARQLKDQGVEFELFLVGDGDLRHEIEDQIEHSGLSDQVQLAGWQDADGVRQALSRSRALVVASFGEGLPVVIMEAMAMSRPVLSTDVGGIRELVVDGETGWLLRPGDSEQLASAMKRVLLTPNATLNRMGKAARLRVLQMHDVDAEAGKLKTLFCAVSESLGPER